MPILNVKLSAPRSEAMTRAVSAMLLETTERILHKKPEVTAITVQYIAPEDWIIAGRSLAEHGLNSFYMDIKITDETNTKQEKSAYIQAIYTGFSDLLGALHPASYVLVEDVRAAAYGYDGFTQEYRYHHPH